MKSELNCHESKLDIIKNLILDCNHSKLVNKERNIDTTQIMSLFSQGNDQAKKFKGKKICGFFGTTGSGKSTAVNYFKGVPLEFYTNNFGDNAVRICPSYKGEYAKIGEMIGTSETIFSQVHEILNENDLNDDINQDLLENVALGDNPGLLDTRGSNYEVCTSLSIDNSIEFCDELKCIVLIIPFMLFELDRSQHIITVINQLEERFPNIRNAESKTYNSFYILINKWRDEKVVNNFKNRLSQLLNEENNSIKNLKNDYSGIQHHNERKKFYQFLYDLNRQRRILFLRLNDDIERQKILETFVKSKGIPKNEYNRSLEGENLSSQFNSQISLTTHTWLNLIFKQYLDVVPNEIENFSTRVENSVKELISLESLRKKLVIEAESCYNTISNLFDKKHRLESELGQIINLGDNELLINELTDINPSVLSTDTDLDYLIRCEENEKNIILNELNILRVRLTTLTGEQNAIKNSLEYNNTYLVKISHGEISQIIYSCSFNNGDKLKYRTLPEDELKAQFQAALRNLTDLSEVVYDKTFIVGEEDSTTNFSVLIERNYSLVPEKTEFDKLGMLEKYKSGGIYKAVIKSENTELFAVNCDITGKKLVLQYKMFFKRGQNPPKLEITHSIPSEVYWKDTIINLKCDIENSLAKSRVIAKDIEDYNTKITSLKNDLNSKQIQIDMLENKKKGAIKINSLEDKIKQLDLDIQYNKNLLDQKKNNIEEKDIQIENEIRILNYNQNNLALLKSKLKNLAIAIIEGYEKNIPQSLYEFVTLAISLNSKHVDQNSQQRSKVQNACFYEYKDYYHSNFEKLLSSAKKQLIN